MNSEMAAQHLVKRGRNSKNQFFIKEGVHSISRFPLLRRPGPERRPGWLVRSPRPPMPIITESIISALTNGKATDCSASLQCRSECTTRTYSDANHSRSVRKLQPDDCANKKASARPKALLGNRNDCNDDRIFNGSNVAHQRRGSAAFVCMHLL